MFWSGSAAVLLQILDILNTGFFFCISVYIDMRVDSLRKDFSEANMYMVPGTQEHCDLSIEPR